MLRPLVVALVLAAAVLIAARPARATWTRDPSANQPVAVTVNFQTRPTIAPDGQGGAYVAWFDNRAGNDDVYVQRLSAKGDPLWTVNGVAVCALPSGQSYPLVVPDGAGGVILAWSDLRNGNYDLYAQRLDPGGAALWAANGVPVCTATGDQWHLQLASDGQGGALAAWTDHRSGDGGDVYVQRVNGAGARLWTVNGVGIATHAGEQQLPDVVHDGAGGAIVAWDDVGFSALRRVDAVGVVQWAGMVDVGNAAFEPRLVSDGAGGAIVAWPQSPLAGSEEGVCVQRVNAAGAKLWNSGFGPWLPLLSMTGSVTNTIDRVEICRDGAGGAIVVWSDRRNGSNNRDLFARRVTGSGIVLWAANGVPVCTAPNNQERWHPIVADGKGGAVITWHDPRADGTTYDTYAQRLDPNGVAQWTANGVLLSTAVASQAYPVLAADGRGGAVVAWHDTRAGLNDVYAQRVDLYGHLGDPSPGIAWIRDLAGDQGGRVRICWNASYRDTLPTAGIELYGVWRQVSEPSAAAALARGARLSVDGAARDAVPGTLRAVPSATELTWWEGVGSIPGRAEPWYTFVAETFRDSTAAGNPLTTFMVDAHDTYGPAFWTSLSDSGYSVDNLPPPAPAPVTGFHDGVAMQLAWGASEANDLVAYYVYRGGDADFVPSPANRIASTTALGWSDAFPAGSWYKLTAADVHGNESEVRVVPPGGTTSVTGPAPFTFELREPAPNPASRAVRVAFSLAREGLARVAVHDAAGRLVRRLVSGTRPAGEAVATWDLRDERGDPVPSGLYFVRLEAGERALVRRLIAIR